MKRLFVEFLTAKGITQVFDNCIVVIQFSTLLILVPGVFDFILFR